MVAAIAGALLVALLCACNGGEPASPIDAPGDGVVDATVVDTVSIDATVIIAPDPVCEPVPPPPTLPPAAVARGTRLVPRTVAEPVTGGVEVPYEIWDTALGIACLPGPYSDGAIRCIPPPSALHLLSARRYADAARTIPVAVEPLGLGLTAGTLAASYQGGPLENPFCSWTTNLALLARIGLQRSGTQYYEEVGPARDLPAGYVLYDLDVLPVDLVELHEVRTQLSGAIAARELRGADGSRLPATALYDLAHDVPVHIAPVGSEQRLLPPRIDRMTGAHRAPPPGDVVSDAWCESTDDVFATTGACISSPRFLSDESGATFHVVPQTATLFGCGNAQLQDARPIPILTYQTASFLAACASVPASEWTQVLDVTEGSGRLTTPVHSIGGVPFDAGGFRRFTDATLGIECSPQPASDRSLRCLPHTSGAIAFSDAACTSRVYASNAGPHPYGREGTERSSTFPAVRGAVTVYSIGAPRPAGPIFHLAPDGCRRLDGWTSYEVTAIVPSSTFAALELRDAP